MGSHARKKHANGRTAKAAGHSGSHSATSGADGKVSGHLDFRHLNSSALRVSPWPSLSEFTEARANGLSLLFCPRT